MRCLWIAAIMFAVSLGDSAESGTIEKRWDLLYSGAVNQSVVRDWLDQAYDDVQPRALGRESWRSFILNHYNGRLVEFSGEIAAFLQKKAAAVSQPCSELMVIIQAYSELDGLVSLPDLQSDESILPIFTSLFSKNEHDKGKWLKFIEVLNKTPPDYAAIIIRFVPDVYCEDALRFMREFANKTDGEATASLRESRAAIERQIVDTLSFKIR